MSANSDFWVVDEEETKDHWLVLKDPDEFYGCIVVWDGEFHFNDYGCVPRMDSQEERDKMEQYYCGDLIEHYHRIKALYEISMKFFEDKYPEEWKDS